MKINEVVEKLKKFEKEIGNVEVDLYMEDIDGIVLGFDEINEINISTDTDGENPHIYIAHRVKKE